MNTEKDRLEEPTPDGHLDITSYPPMLLDSTALPDDPGDLDWPGPGEFESYLDRLIANYATTDFAWSWKSFTSTRWDWLRVKWIDRKTMRPFVLPQSVWELLVRVLLDDAALQVSSEVPQGENDRGAVSNVRYRMDRVEEHRCVLTWLDMWMQRPRSEEPPQDQNLSANLTPDFVVSLIADVELALPRRGEFSEAGRFLTPATHMTVFNGLNALRMQLPSTHKVLSAALSPEAQRTACRNQIAHRAGGPTRSRSCQRADPSPSPQNHYTPRPLLKYRSDASPPEIKISPAC